MLATAGGEAAMPGWLGVTLAVAFGLVAGYRAVRRDAPGTLMMLGMALMSVDMAGLGPGTLWNVEGAHPRGLWWAAGFAALALWPLVSRRAWRACASPSSHLVGGVAMIYMCVPVLAHADAGAPPTGTALAVATTPLAAVGHHHDDGAALAAAIPNLGAPVTLPQAVLAVLGWCLVCYFLLSTVTTVTRRDADGALALPRLTVLGEAVAGLGTVIILVAMT